MGTAKHLTTLYSQNLPGRLGIEKRCILSICQKQHSTVHMQRQYSTGKPCFCPALSCPFLLHSFVVPKKTLWYYMKLVWNGYAFPECDLLFKISPMQYLLYIIQKYDTDTASNIQFSLSWLGGVYTVGPRTYPNVLIVVYQQCN